jgi:hypothetical protein
MPSAAGSSLFVGKGKPRAAPKGNVSSLSKKEWLRTQSSARSKNASSGHSTAAHSGAARQDRLVGKQRKVMTSATTAARNPSRVGAVAAKRARERASLAGPMTALKPTQKKEK